MSCRGSLTVTLSFPGNAAVLPRGRRSHLSGLHQRRVSARLKRGGRIFNEGWRAERRPCLDNQPFMMACLHSAKDNDPSVWESWAEKYTFACVRATAKGWWGRERERERLTDGLTLSHTQISVCVSAFWCVAASMRSSSRLCACACGRMVRRRVDHV